MWNNQTYRILIFIFAPKCVQNYVGQTSTKSWVSGVCSDVKSIETFTIDSRTVLMMTKMMMKVSMTLTMTMNHDESWWQWQSSPPAQDSLGCRICVKSIETLHITVMTIMMNYHHQYHQQQPHHSLCHPFFHHRQGLRLTGRIEMWNPLTISNLSSGVVFCCFGQKLDKTYKHIYFTSFRCKRILLRWYTNLDN